MSTPELQQLLTEVLQGHLLEGTLSSPLEKKNESVQKVGIRPLMLKGQGAYQLSEHVGPKVLHKNLTYEECARYLEQALKGYRQGIFSTSAHSYHVLQDKNGDFKVIKKTAQQALSLPLAHNRQKRYLLPEGTPVPFLVHLGVMTNDGKVVAKKYDKFRQVNRFLEMVADVIDEMPAQGPLRVVDFGCGKAYLTFALHYYFTHILKREVWMVGLDLKQDVIEHCQALTQQLGLEGLVFQIGDINHFALDSAVDMVIALHACDTATDAALAQAVRWKSKVILCVPCCQHELYNQVKNEALAPLLRHGILRERFAALATDAARSELLTMLGYEVQVLEFIDMEHTPKNLLIRAVKSSSKGKAVQAAERYRHFKEALHIHPFLEKLISEM